MKNGFARNCVCCPPVAASTSRRNFIAGGVAALGLAAAPARVFAQAAAPSLAATVTPKTIIDVHHHVAPPAFIRELIALGYNEPPQFNWTVQKSLDDMDKAGVATAITSITTPGVWFGNDSAARRLARSCNDFGATLMRDHPGRFGLFAALPLPDVDGSLKEIEYAFDTLHADGVGLMTSFGDKWLGDPAFDPVMAELNRRKAVVYTHPTVADCCRGILPLVQRSVIEFQTDTSRAIGSVVFSGTASRYADIRFIWSHGGGTMPFLYERYIRMPQLNPNVKVNIPHGVDYELKKFHYDVAQVAHPAALASLVRVAPVSQILFGTDYPYRTSADHVKGVDEFFTSEADRRAITRENALALIPRLKAG
ncbi:MAG TPA: amidohydrolase family protein [Xanthobacteraceae bacterium]